MPNHAEAREPERTGIAWKVALTVGAAFLGLWFIGQSGADAAVPIAAAIWTAAAVVVLRAR